MTLPHRIYIEPAYQKDGRLKVTERGLQFEATYEGELICVSHQPLLDGARVLRQRGLTGPVETWDEVGQFRRMHSTIEKAARLTVVEPRTGGIRFDKWNAPDKLRGLGEERRKRAAGSSATSDPQTTPDGLTAEVAGAIDDAESSEKEDA